VVNQLRHSDNMAAIKKFFEKRLLNVKFKKAGEGHRLADEGKVSAPSSTSNLPSASKPVQTVNAVPTEERKMAAEAALARMNQQKTGERDVCFISLSQSATDSRRT
jgi:UBX domain-containing protein 6